MDDLIQFIYFPGIGRENLCVGKDCWFYTVTMVVVSCMVVVVVSRMVVVVFLLHDDKFICAANRKNAIRQLLRKRIAFSSIGFLGWNAKYKEFFWTINFTHSFLKPKFFQKSGRRAA